jgi:hypothetical protein
MQNAKQFSKQLNLCLDELGTPHNSRERSLILSKMLHIPKQEAWSLIEGQVFPAEALLDLIGEELDIDITAFKKKV